MTARQFCYKDISLEMPLEYVLPCRKQGHIQESVISRDLTVTSWGTHQHLVKEYLLIKMCCSQNRKNNDVRSCCHDTDNSTWVFVLLHCTMLIDTTWICCMLCYALDMDSGELFVYLISILTVWEIIVVYHSPWNELSKTINVKNLARWLSQSSTWWMIVVILITLSQSLLSLWQLPQLPVPMPTLIQDYL